MLRRTLIFAAVLSALLAAGQATVTVTPISDPLIGARPQNRLTESWWAERHNAVLQQVRQHPETQLLLLGDSITNNYDKAKLPDENFAPTWETFYAPRHALNLGFSGDTTANLLWRLENGEVQGLQPKLAILLIGTNNTNGTAQSSAQNAPQTEVGIDAVVASLEGRLPHTRILLLGILPSGISADKTRRDAEVNRYLAATYADNPRVTYLDIGSIFFRNHSLDASLFYDPRLSNHAPPLHPDTIGQRMMAEAIEPTLARWMDDRPALPLGAMTDINTALIPVERLEQDSYDWYARHHAALTLKATMHPSIVMLGDSITHFWAGPPQASHRNGPVAWSHAFGDQPVLNLGFGWDRTQNVLWRIRAGEFDGLTPATVVLNIGTNNLTGTEHARANSPAEIVDAIHEIVDQLLTRSPQTHIVLMAIFPRGARPDDPLRAPIRETNRLLTAHFANDPTVTMLDLSASFLAPDGSLPAMLMPDGTHPSEAGYEIWAKALRAVIPALTADHNPR